MKQVQLAGYEATHFRYAARGKVATITLNRPERLNALTFEVYRELTDTFAAIRNQPDIRAVVITGAGRAFCSGGDQRIRGDAGMFAEVLL